MTSTERLNTHQKALRINLDPTSYGSFAEIGAGQEVVRWFLVVGGASGTVAKSISAYDKEVSDDLYGFGARYVSGERLQAMLDSEWSQLMNQLNKSRGSNARFFSFVDTISARNYAGTNEPHGWVGLRFQLQPGGPPNDIVLHVNLRDTSNLIEQEAIGILGVNLIYAAFFQLETKESFFENIAQDVEKRIEVDYAEVRGAAFEGWDQRTILAHLVTSGLAEAVCFPCSGPPVPPIDVLHKKATVLAPGSFEHVDSEHAAIHNQLLTSGIQQLRGELAGKNPAPAGFSQAVSSYPAGPYTATPQSGVQPTITIDPAAMPAGTELSVGDFQLSTGEYSGEQQADVVLIDTSSYTCSSTPPDPNGLPDGYGPSDGIGVLYGGPGPAGS